MVLKSMLRLTLLALAFASLDVMPLAAAGVETAPGKCDGKDCTYARAAVPIPAGWTRDAGAEEKLKMVVLVRNGQSFLSNDAFILATVSPLPERFSIEDRIAADQNGFRMHFPELKIVAEPDIARAGGSGVFKVFLYEKPGSGTQRFERVATTLATGADGKRYAVGISLSAASINALDGADSSLREVLRGF